MHVHCVCSPSRLVVGRACRTLPVRRSILRCENCSRPDSRDNGIPIHDAFGQDLGCSSPETHTVPGSKSVSRPETCRVSRSLLCLEPLTTLECHVDCHVTRVSHRLSHCLSLNPPRDTTLPERFGTPGPTEISGTISACLTTLWERAEMCLDARVLRRFTWSASVPRVHVRSHCRATAALTFPPDYSRHRTRRHLCCGVFAVDAYLAQRFVSCPLVSCG